MKLKYLVAPLLFAAAAATGCQESAETYPAIYMTDAQNNPDKSMTIDEPPAETSITVSSSVVMEHDVRIQLEVQPELLAAYNDKYGKNYQIPPEDSYALSSTETTILAGYNTSSAIGFTVSSVSEFAEGVTYCVPVGIKTVSGGISVLEPSRTLFIVLKTPVISKAIYLGSGNIYDVPSFQENSDLAALPQLTLEARVRFGDVKVDPDCIQICHDSYQPAASDKPFSLEKWYHVAAVWTGSSWDIYIDGQYATGVETQGETIDLTSDNAKGFHLGASYGRGRTLNGYVAECRVWTRALSQAEIANNMNYVDPTSDGLLAYWRMNAWEPKESGSGNIVRDLTGHGYDAIGDSSNPTMMDTKWN